MALLRVLTNIRQTQPDVFKLADPLVVAHYNHKTRGTDSDRDEQFVRDSCEQLEIRCVVGIAKEEPADLSEESLRSQRLQFFSHSAAEENARFVVTGHHRDDQLETILFRLFRGSGLAGLAGIPPMRPLSPHVTIVRPLLDTPRQSLRQLLEDLQQPFRNDPSNLNAKYTRNFIRHELLPTIEQRFQTQMPGAILRLAEQAREWELFLDQQCRPLIEQIDIQPAQTTFDNAIFSGIAILVIKATLKRIWQSNHWPLQQMGSAWWNRLAEAVTTNQDRTLDLPGNIRFQIRGTTIEIRPTQRTP